MAAYRRVYDSRHLQADCPKNRDQLRNPTLCNRVWATFLPTYTVSQKNDTDVACYNFNAHQPILVISGGDVAERVCAIER